MKEKNKTPLFQLVHDVMKYQSKVILDNENTLKNARQITKRFYKVIFIFPIYL